MIEKVFHFSTRNDKIIEKVLMDANLSYLHMVLNKGEELPEHVTNAVVYLSVIRGNLSIVLR